MAFTKSTIESVRDTFSTWVESEAVHSIDAPACKALWENEAKMLMLEQLQEINESLKTIALLGNCVTETENTQFQIGTEERR